MAQYYDQVKSMRSAKVGTIMPWGGDGSTGFLVSNVPKGWVVCKGQTVSASDYPLLASVIGDTYSATASMADSGGNEYEFPYIDTAATFTFPNLSAKCMVDLESSYLDDAKYQMGQTDPKNKILDTNGTKLGDLLVSGTGGGTASYFSNVKTTWQATADIDFTLNLTGNLYFKFSNMLLQAPDFVETIYTLRRKLGINHTPGHSHSDVIPTAQVQPSGPAIFRTDEGIDQHNTASLGICNVSVSPVSCAFKSANPTQWANGSTDISFYGNANYENTLPRMSDPMEFVTDSSGKNYWGHVPATDWRQTGSNGSGSGAFDTNRGSGPKAEFQRQTVSGGLGVTASIVNTEPMKSHQTQAHTGMHPRPILQRNRPNFYGYSRDGQTPPQQGGITDHPEAMTPFQVSNLTLTENSQEITLPAGTNLGRTYSNATGTTTWTQYDAITPFMYVIEVIPNGNENDCKYLHLQEGTSVQSVKKETNGTYTVRLTKQIKGDKVAGWGAVSGRVIQFKYATYPTALNQPNKNPISSDFGSHGHGSFEITQGMGSMAGPPSHTASNADASSLSAQSLENALNIDCDTTQPSLTLTYIIKAY
tara:strand:+ start:467 stop:2236 length:1770 start_codon:yes stop_codon:yes gene_type:complete